MTSVRVLGHLRELGGPSLANFIVSASGREPRRATTDSDGRFALHLHDSPGGPLFLSVIDPDSGQIIHRAACPLEVTGEEHVLVEVPTHRLPRRTLRLLDTDGRHRTDFEIGDALLAHAQGVEPSRMHRVRVLDDRGREVVSVSLLSDRYGVIAPTVVWPDIGLGEGEQLGPYVHPSHEAALAALGGSRFEVELHDGRAVHRTGVHLSNALTRPRIFSATSSGAPRRGLLLERDELRVRAMNVSGPLVDVYLVERRHDWRPGDAFAPVRNPDGSEVMLRLRPAPDQTSFDAVLWPRELLRPGSYDILMRSHLEHEFRSDERVLRATDVLSDRLITSVVIREDIFRYKPILLGCVNAMREMSGRRLSGSPYFAFTNNFPRGTDVWASLDPNGLMPQAIGKKIRYYVIAHKTPAQWAASSALVDVNNTDVEIITSSGCINGNEALVWSNPQQPGQYDLVVDFGNNAANPATFQSDGSFDPPLDMIDGYLNVGFYVTDDPSVPGTYAVGQTSYNLPAVTIPATGVWPGALGSTPSGTLSLPIVAEVRYPADVSGVDVPFSGAQPSYAVVVVMHGMHSTADPSYQGYNYLLEHLASHGFVAVSIDCNAVNAINGMQDTRAHAILEHLSTLQSLNTSPGLYQGKLDMTRIGIMGHSRGGDGVVQAEIFNRAAGGPNWNIGAIVALAPTDFSGTSPSPLALSTSKFLCMYGGNDGDVWGGTNPATTYAGTGFRFYDRASIEKAMVFIPGATHNRFNTLWGTEYKVDTASPKILGAAQHHVLLCGYMTAFYQIHLQGRSEQRAYFTGELKIPQASTVEVHNQYRPDLGLFTVDDFETAPSLTTSSSGGSVSFAALDGQPGEDALATLDGHSPHQKRGLHLKWNAAAARYETDLVGQQDLSGFRWLSFRVGQQVDSAANPGGLAQDLYVRLQSPGNSRAVRAGYFGTIPFPYVPAYTASWTASQDPNTKAALKTIRIPLSAWTIKCLNAPIVDLTSVEFIAFEFGSTPTGELLVDDIELTS